MDTSVNYLGLRLSSPIIAVDTGYVHDIDDYKRMEDCGAGAVLLKPKFEEEFIYDLKRNTSVFARTNSYGESYAYVTQRLGDYFMDDYFADVQKITDAVSIPVIGSVNCISFESWINYMDRYEKAGCKALELTMAIRPYDINLSSQDIERVYNQVLTTVRRAVTIPVSVKIGYNFTNLAKFIHQISWTGIQGITLFDKETLMDIDVNDFQWILLRMEDSAGVLKSLLQWVSILSGKTQCGLSVAMGILTVEDVVKSLLVGAETTQVSDCLAQNGIEYLRDLQQGLCRWMEAHQFENIEQFCGRMTMPSRESVSSFMRMQSMRVAFDDKQTINHN